MTTVATGTAFVVAAALGAVVYRDASRVGLSPTRWAGVVFGSTAAAVLFRLAVPDVPVPGVLVIAVLGPAVYLLERDDSTHDDTADPTTLPSRSSQLDDDEE
jgi:hypothetical protein